VAQVRSDAAPRHLFEKVLHRLGAEPVAGFGARVEEAQFEALAPTFAAQLLVDAEDKLEHRPAAHRHRLVGVAGKAEGDAAALHLAQPVADLLGRGDAFARRDRMLDARQLLQKAPAGGDDERVVLHIARRGLHQTGIGRKPGHLGGVELHVHAAQEVLQRHDELLASAQPAGDPDDARQVVQFGTRRHQRDGHLLVALAKFTDGGQARETGAKDGDLIVLGHCNLQE
jgi:hypothetical protein